MAGDRGRIFSSPASVRAVSKPPMIFVVHDGACCACQMATASSVAWSRITVSGEDEVAPSSMAVAPLASIGSMRSDRHASDSVPARRPRLGLTRSLVRMHSNSIHDVRRVQRVMCPALAPRRIAGHCVTLGCSGERNRWSTTLSAQSSWLGRAPDQTHNPLLRLCRSRRPAVVPLRLQTPGPGPLRSCGR
jgi:hypothetical protein